MVDPLDDALLEMGREEFLDFFVGDVSVLLGVDLKEDLSLFLNFFSAVGSVCDEE